MLCLELNDGFSELELFFGRIKIPVIWFILLPTTAQTTSFNYRQVAEKK
jgi:hypothetical protein